jgi:hypothetical protein
MNLYRSACRRSKPSYLVVVIPWVACSTGRPTPTTTGIGAQLRRSPCRVLNIGSYTNDHGGDALSTYSLDKLDELDHCDVNPFFLATTSTKISINAATRPLYFDSTLSVSLQCLHTTFFLCDHKEVGPPVAPSLLPRFSQRLLAAALNLSAAALPGRVGSLASIAASPLPPTHSDLPLQVRAAL